MRFIPLNEATVATGREAYARYQAAILRGSYARAREHGITRMTGLPVLTGVIYAAIQHGITEEDALIDAAARASLCHRSTVRKLLHHLSGNHPRLHLWCLRNGSYSVNTCSSDTALDVLLAA